MTKPLIIVGLQKSGTTLLKKILASSDQIVNLFAAEGNGLWGNTPPFSPTAAPVGEIYQLHQGRHGHFLSADDFRSEDGDLIKQRLATLLAEHPKNTTWLHKNPYLTVRLAWLKKILPNAVVLACVRKPLPNVFSLLKRYQHSVHGHQPEHGWWGVKPQLWQDCVSSDRLTTAAQQWRWVNHQLMQDRAHVDCFVPYHQLSTAPQLIVDQISQTLGTQLKCSLPEVACMDDQWRSGGSAISANQANQNEYPELFIPGLSQLQIEQVEQQCNETWTNMEQVI